MSIPEVTHNEVHDSTVMLDVRERDEWSLGRAPHAVLIPLGELPERLSEVPSERPLVVTCRSGKRSARAVEFLTAQGIEAVNLTGGMIAWHQAGRPMVHDGDGRPDVR